MSRLFPTERLFSAIEQLVDERVGIVSWIKEFPRDPGMPDFFHYYAEACNAGALGGQRNFRCTGGASTSRSLAIGKAFGEAVERYCSAFYDWSTLPFTSYAAAPFLCVPPHEFALYTPWQCARPNFPFVPFNETTSIHWVAATDPLMDEIWQVPAAMVYVPYAFDDSADEQHIAQRMSTGLACHCSAAEAALSAICEVVERDAFTIAWQATMDVPEIRVETLDALNQGLIRRLQRIGCSVRLFDLTFDHGIPTILSVFRAKTAEAPALAFAAASSLSPRVSARKSLEELAHTLRLAHELKINLPPFVPSPDFEDVETQDDHVHLYCDQAQAHLADFLLDSPRPRDFQLIQDLSTGNPHRDLQTLLTKIRDVNHRVLLIDLTTPDVQEAGLSVMRAVIPGFHPLFIGHRRRALGGTRLWEVPQKLGYKGITPSKGDNPAPHPFP